MENGENHNQVPNKCNPAVINSILGDSFLYEAATQMRSFLKPSKFPLANSLALSAQAEMCISLIPKVSLIVSQMLLYFTCTSCS